jgi:hypothetical protein
MLDNASTGRKFSDSVEAINKATRWGQLNQATNLVDPIYRGRFAETHAHWGQVIQIGNSEVMQLEIASDKESAVSVIAYEWYTNNGMDLHQSVVRQRWSRVNGNFALFSEAVVQGDPRLLASRQQKPMSADTGALISD